VARAVHAVVSLRAVRRDREPMAVLWNALNPYSALVFRETEAAAQRPRIHIESLEVRGPPDFDAALRSSLERRARAIITVEDPLTFGCREQIAEFFVKNGLPGIFGLKSALASGGVLHEDWADLARKAFAQTTQ
jgi:hypothetical protein